MSQPLRQHFSPSEHSASVSHISTSHSSRMSPLGLGHIPDRSLRKKRFDISVTQSCFMNGKWAFQDQRFHFNCSSPKGKKVVHNKFYILHNYYTKQFHSVFSYITRINLPLKYNNYYI